MFKRFILAAAILLAPVAALGQGQPASWRYSWESGISTATYPGRVVAPDLVNSIDINYYLTPAQKTSVAACDQVADVTAAVQTAVNMAGETKQTLHVGGGCYVLSAPVNILKTISLVCDQGITTFFLVTPNTDGIVIGDGTELTKGLTYKTSIHGCVFNPGASVGTSTSGAAIRLKYVAYVDLDRITVYGSNGTRRIWNGIESERATDWTLSNSVVQQVHGNGVYTWGTPGLANRNVGGRLDWLYCITADEDCVNLGPSTVGTTVNSLVAYDYSKYGIRYNPGPDGPEAQNLFVFQPDLESKVGSLGGFYCQSGGTVQIVGGWIGASAGTIGVTSSATCNGLNTTELRIVATDSGYDLSGPAAGIIGGEVTGFNTAGKDAVTIRATADSLNVTGMRIRQWDRYGFNFIGQPAQANIVGVNFKNIGTNEVNGQNFAPTSLPPVFSGNQSQVSYALTAATTPTGVRLGRNFYQMTGTTNVQNLPIIGQGVRITIQSAAGGNNYVAGGNLVFTGALAVPAFGSVSWYCDGVEWFLDGKSF